MTAPRHKVLNGGRAGSSATVKGFTKARKRRFSDRLKETFQAVGDYRTDAMTDAQALQEAFDQASESATRLGQRVKLSMEGQIYDLGSTTVQFKSGVDYDFTGSVIIHRKITVTNYNSIPFTGTSISNFSITGLELAGPGSAVYLDVIRKGTSYAVQFIGCHSFHVDMVYTNGNSGILLSDCYEASAFIDGYELNGTALAVKGGYDLTIGARVRNAGLFCIFGTESATRVRVLYTDKWYDGTKINEYDFPYLWNRRKYSTKVALNPISGMTWQDNNGGELVITVTRDPTAGTSAIPALSVGNDVVLTRVNNDTLSPINGEYTIRALTTTTITVACATDPGTYTTLGWVGDMENTVMVLGLESLGVTYTCSFWTVDYLKSRNSGDAGGSFTGNFMTVVAAEVFDGTLNGITLSGEGSIVHSLQTRTLGHWVSAVAKIGGKGGTFTPSASNFPKNCTFVKMVSIGDIATAFEIADAARYAEFSPNAACDKRFVYAESDTPGTYWTFRTAEAPEFFGPDSPQDYGFVEPEDETEVAIWHDGLTEWLFQNTIVGDVLPINPTGCKVVQYHYTGPGTPYIDLVGPDYGNTYPSPYPAFTGPMMPVNGEYLILPGAGSGTITLSSTPQEVVAYFYGARSVGGATISRITGTSVRHGIKIQRTAGNTSTASIYTAVSITGDDLYWLLGKYPSVKMQAWCGDDWSDNNQHMSWTMFYSTTVLALDSDLNPTGSTTLDNNSTGVIGTETTNVSFTSDTILPTNAAQLIVRIYYSPTNTVELPAAGADDWVAFEKLVIGPSDADFSFRSEERTLTQLRLDAL